MKAVRARPQGTDWEDAPMVNARRLDAAAGETLAYDWPADRQRGAAARGTKNLHAFFGATPAPASAPAPTSRHKDCTTEQGGIEGEGGQSIYREGSAGRAGEGKYVMGTEMGTLTQRVGRAEEGMRGAEGWASQRQQPSQSGSVVERERVEATRPRPGGCSGSGANGAEFGAAEGRQPSSSGSGGGRSVGSGASLRGVVKYTSKAKGNGARRGQGPSKQMSSRGTSSQTSAKANYITDFFRNKS
eukprot:1180229-Prorocentrum_minimum.AAC.7